MQHRKTLLPRIPRNDLLKPNVRDSKNFFRNSPLPATDAKAPSCLKCDKTRCDLCTKFLDTSKTFSSAQTDKKYIVRQRPSCNSTNVIYLVHCKKCNLQYVESNIAEFKIRFRNHRSTTMKTKTKKLRSRHTL